MKIFLDLENTIIKSWDEPILINVDIIREFLKQNTEIGIFSFAIFNNDDLKHFNDFIKFDIESTLNVRIVECPTRQQMMSIVRKKTGIIENDDELSLIYGKEKVFEEYIAEKRVDALLIDDVVENKIIFSYDVQNVIRFVNLTTKLGVEHMQGR